MKRFDAHGNAHGIARSRGSVAKGAPARNARNKARKQGGDSARGASGKARYRKEWVQPAPHAANDAGDNASGSSKAKGCCYWCCIAGVNQAVGNRRNACLRGKNCGQAKSNANDDLPRGMVKVNPALPVLTEECKKAR